MDPKSLVGKPPEFPIADPSFGAKLAQWVMKDMDRAKREREERGPKAPPPKKPR